MGNTKSTSCSNKSSITDEDLKINDYDMTIYELRKEKIFKGTIAVCIVYAFIALLIIVSSYLSSTIKYVLFNKFLPLTIVFIIGTILLIIYLYYNILNFKPIKINKNYDYPNISCPDYWTLEYDSNLSKYFDSNSINANLFNYRCVLNSNIFSKSDIYFNRLSELTGSKAIGSDAIGMTGNDHNKFVIAASSSYNKEGIDSDDQKYIVADINDNKNLYIIDKIVGRHDSNVYKNLIESSLLMNNYYKPDANKEEYRHISKSLANDVSTTFSTEKDNLKIHEVNSDRVKSSTTDKLSVNHLIKLPDINSSTTTNYINEIKTGTVIDTLSVLNKVPLVCNRVYPLLLAAKDKDLSKNSKGRYDENILRCAYSKMCGIPWSDMNCDKYD
jgi:hypothetical protein